MIRRRKVIKKKEWVPSAVPFFLVGFAYYIISPAFVFRFLAEDNELLYVAKRYLDSSYFDRYYFLDAFFILGSFLLGYVLGRVATRPKKSVLDYGAYQKGYPFLLAVSFSILIAYFALNAAASGGGFFTGYKTYNIAVLGPFSTCVFMSAWFVNFFSKPQIRLLFLSFFVFCSVLLLGWGSRMFFILGIMTLILGVVSEKRKLLKSMRLYAFVAIFGLLVVVVGITRQGEGELSSDTFIGILFAEPLFTSIAGNLYIENSGGRPTYGVPHDIFASVIHFVPSAVFPGKVELMSEITFDQNVESPFGAKSLIVNLYSNFGRFYPLFLSIIGFYFGFLFKKAQFSVFFRAMYFSALPILVLLFFREGLVTVIKVLVFNGLIVPLFVSLFLIWLSPRTMTDIRFRFSRHRGRGDPLPRKYGLSSITPRQV